MATTSERDRLRYDKRTQTRAQVGHWHVQTSPQDKVLVQRHTPVRQVVEPGLQVLTVNGWVDAVAPPGQVIINTGMMLERLTNGLIPTGIHRVVAAPGQPGERYSVVQFCHPTPWTVLAPLASCCTPEHPQRFSAMVSADALDLVLYQINLKEDARRLDA